MLLGVLICTLFGEEQLYLHVAIELIYAFTVIMSYMYQV